MQVSTGEEGFFGMNSSQKLANPLSPPGHAASGPYWAAKIGQDFQSQHASPSLDYAAMHLWPDDWNVLDPGFPTTWIGNHSTTSAVLGKPVLMQEVWIDDVILSAGLLAVHSICQGRDTVGLGIYVLGLGRHEWP